MADDTIMALVSQRLAAAELLAIDEHLDRCLFCRRVVAEYARAAPEHPSAAAAPPSAQPAAAQDPWEVGSAALSGTLIDRYLVIRRVGAGSMGVVYEAYDPQLQRPVALKLIKEGGDPAATDLPERRARLLREAQAMARLSHPNVIAVYDTGVYQERVYLVMEFVDGWTLRQEPSAGSWRNRLALFLAAGRGLSAAHQAGLVHRDFKPDNVLVGKDGRVRVGDFGLVSLAAPAVAESGPPGAAEPGYPEDAGDASLTQSGAILGTLRYLAPEQYEGHGASAQTDQFAFCVALYEALYAQPPFAGATYAALRHNVLSGQVRPEPVGSAVPAWLRAVLLRGLKTQPAQRYPAMAELLAELARDPQARRQRQLLRLALAVSLVAAAGLGAASWRAWSASRTPPCQGLGAPVAAVWNFTTQAMVRGAFLRTRRPEAAATAARVQRQLDDYAAHWVALREGTCAATRVLGTQSQQQLDLRMRCLDRQLAEFGAQIQVFAELGQEPEVLDKSVAAVAQLGPLRRCADGEALGSGFPRPTDSQQQAHVQQIEQQLDRAGALQNAGRYKDGLRIAELAAREAEAAAYAPVTAQALYRRLTLQRLDGDYKAVESSVPAAAQAAAQARDDRLSAEVWLEWLASLITLARYDEALALRPIVEAAITRTGEEGLMTVKLHNSLGTLFLRRDDLPRARQYYAAALALRDKLPPAGHPDRGLVLQNLGLVYFKEGDLAAAQRHFERALAVQQEMLGATHPEVARVLHHLCVTRISLKDAPAALALCNRALAIEKATLAAGHPSVAMTLTALAQIYSQVGQTESAQKALGQALAMQEATLGPAHPQVAQTLNDLASLLIDQKSYRAAAAALDRALSIYNKGLGPNHSSLGITLVNYGLLLAAQGKYPLARTYFLRALRIFETAAGKGQDHPNVAQALLGIGQCALELRHPDRAIPLLERALQISLARPSDPALGASAQFLLARSLAAAGQDRHRARALAQLARNTFAQGGPALVDQLAEVDKWLRRAPGVRVAATP